MRIQVQLTRRLQDYVAEMSVREPDLLRELRAVTDRLPERLMQTSPEQSQFLRVLVRALGVRRAIEVGVFTGYSLLSTALALPAGGLVIGCEQEERWASVAEDFATRLGVRDRIEIRVGDAAQTLRGLLDQAAGETFDFVFIDADKANYDVYYELALALVRPGGLIVVDNVLWHGAVVDPRDHEPDTQAIRAFNAKLRTDRRVDISLLPFADGLTFACKR